METRTLGESNLVVTRLGLGLAALGRPGYINLGHADDLGREYDAGAMESRAHEVLDAAWEAGIRYLDAARSYGRAEQFLSTWLLSRHIAPDDLTVGSKWGYTYTAGWNVEAEQHEIKDHSLPVLNRQIAESRGFLGAYLDLYQIHSATLQSGVLENREVLSRLAELRGEGLRIGLTTSGPAQSEAILRAMDIRFDGERLFTAVQATWNLLAQETAGSLEAAHDAGMGVIVKEALANGRLTGRNREPAFDRKRKLLEKLAASRDATIDAVAISTVLAQPWADVVLSGAATVEQLESNVEALEINLAGELQELLEAMPERPQSYWQTRSALAWN